VAFDPFLYVAFGLGLLAGRIYRPPSPWLERAQLLSVVALIALLGDSLAQVDPATLLGTVPHAVALTGLVLGATAGIYVLIVWKSPPPHATGSPSTTGSRFPASAVFVVAVVAGYAFGRLTALPTYGGITWALYVLLVLVALGLRWVPKQLTRVWVPLLAAVLGATIAAAVFAALGWADLSVAFASTYAFGWYTLAGPLVTARAGAALGFVAFLANFLREDLTMLLSPAIGRKVRGEGLAALGGATAMDTTLYFVTRYGDPDAGSLALASGLVLTVGASLVLPLLLAV
jgi:uncharacterized membrane protein YbjE (DUF340 family)